MSATRIWTAGHSNRSVLELLELLSAVPIRRLVDVRTVPRSRRNPQFDRDALAWELEQAGLGYRHAPELGGLRKPREHSLNSGLGEDGLRGYADHMQTSEFATGVDRLLGEAAADATVVMCAEASPWHCHRSLLCDALLAYGAEVQHLVAVDRVEPHRTHPLARVRGKGVTYPGLL